jgi:hypothetical protein
MDETIDTRSFRKEAYSLIKSSQSIDKILSRNFKTNLKTKNCESFDEFNDSMSQNFSSKSTIRSYDERTMPVDIKPLNKSVEFKSKAFNIFKFYSGPINKNNFDSTQYSFPTEQLNFAINHLFDTEVDYYALFSFNQFEKTKKMISWLEFKELIKEIKKIQNSTNNDNYSSTNLSHKTFKSTTNSYNSLINKQRYASTVNYDNFDHSKFIDTEQSASVINLRTKTVPIGFLKDELVGVFKKNKKNLNSIYDNNNNNNYNNNNNNNNSFNVDSNIYQQNKEKQQLKKLNFSDENSLLSGFFFKK